VLDDHRDRGFIIYAKNGHGAARKGLGDGCPL
jgi:hypothetical protein